jgi:transmembrane 9 superfamily protein 2/4
MVKSTWPIIIIMRRPVNAAVLLLPALANAFYLPGAAPRNYVPGEKVDLFVNALTPILSNEDDAKLVLYQVTL